MNHTLWQYPPNAPAETLLAHHRRCRWVVTVWTGATALMSSTLVELMLTRNESAWMWWFAAACGAVFVVGLAPAVAGMFWAGEVERTLAGLGLGMNPRLRIGRLAARRMLKMLLWMMGIYLAAFLLRR